MVGVPHRRNSITVMVNGRVIASDAPAAIRSNHEVQTGVSR